jgi:hypothetical protein
MDYLGRDFRALCLFGWCMENFQKLIRLSDNPDSFPIRAGKLAPSEISEIVVRRLR